MFFDFFSPKAQDNPSASAKLPVHFPVALSVLFDFWNPIFRIGPFLQLALKQIPILSVPELRIAKDRDFCFLKTDVGSAGNVSAVLSVAHSEVP